MNTIKRSGSARAFKGALKHGAMRVLGACAIAWGSAAHAQTTDVPQAWINYAQLVGAQFQRSLEGYDDTANELHAYLEDRMQHPQRDAVPSMVDVRATDSAVWHHPTDDDASTASTRSSVM